MYDLEIANRRYDKYFAEHDILCPSCGHSKWHIGECSVIESNGPCNCSHEWHWRESDG